MFLFWNFLSFLCGIISTGVVVYFAMAGMAIANMAPLIAICFMVWLGTVAPVYLRYDLVRSKSTNDD